MLKNLIQNTIILTFSLVITVLFAEAVIQSVDPLGGIEYQNNLEIVAGSNTPDLKRLVTMKPGHYQAIGWSYSVRESGFRVTPNAPSLPSCTIAMIGDSVTFGFGVNDGETFTALLQGGHGNVVFKNMALSGYNAANFEPVAQSVNVDGYIYLQTPNDYQDKLVGTPVKEKQRKSFYGIRYYFYQFTNGISQSDIEWREYEGLYAGFLERDNLIILTPSGNEWLENEHHAIPIEMWSDTVSAIDGHPSAMGHRQLELAMRKYVDSFLIDTCGV